MMAQRALLVLALLGLSACSTIKSLFPDKEKDYQYTTQIPALVLPEDLRKLDTHSFAKGIKPIANRAATENMPATEPAIANTASATVEPIAPLVENLPPPASNLPKPHAFNAELITMGDSSTRLRLGLPLGNAWRVVSKALSRKSIEVTKRDQQAGVFQIHYIANAEKVQDDSFWDEMTFLFDGFQSDEQAYLLQLQEIGTETDVIIMNTEQKPLNNAASLRLLKVLQATIKADSK